MWVKSVKTGVDKAIQQNVFKTTQTTTTAIIIRTLLKKVFLSS